MRRHTLIGERILAAAPALGAAARLVRSSHEAWDGSGYPDGLAGDEIPLGARIIAVCDSFDAMISDRPYAPPKTTARRSPSCAAAPERNSTRTSSTSSQRSWPTAPGRRPSQRRKHQPPHARVEPLVWRAKPMTSGGGQGGVECLVHVGSLLDDADFRVEVGPLVEHVAVEA